MSNLVLIVFGFFFYIFKNLLTVLYLRFPSLSGSTHAHAHTLNALSIIDSENDMFATVNNILISDLSKQKSPRFI